MNTIHIISHTHWDREWYRTFQQFRLKLVHLVDNVLEILANDQNYQCFMLDGQTIVLDDYLQMRPGKEKVLRKYIQQGRILIGPWHILPDLFLVGSESHIRNLLTGSRTCNRFGARMMIGYIPDPFGHPGQIPQILRGFDIETACLWRGVDIANTEFWWRAPDGSQVLVAYLHDGYGNGAKLPVDDLEGFTNQLAERAAALLPDSATANLLIMLGTDHMEPPRKTSEAITYAAERLRSTRIVHSTLPQYLLTLKQHLITKKIVLPVVEGELRACRRMHLLPGVLSSRMWIKQRNHASENLLVRWVEPFTTFQEHASPQPPTSAILDLKAELICHAWHLLMENHPHDSICGCSIDQVHEEMKIRFDQVDQIGEELRQQTLETIAGAIQTDPAFLGKETVVSPLSSALVVFNPLAGPRTDVVTAMLVSPNATEFDLVDESGTTLAYQEQGLGTHEIANMTMDSKAIKTAFSHVKQGHAAGMTIQDLKLQRDGAVVYIEAVLAKGGEPNLAVWNTERKRLDEYLADSSITTYHARARSISSRLTVVVPDVPGHGYRTLWIRPRNVEIKSPRPLHPILRMLLPLGSLPFVQRLATRKRRFKPPYKIDNELFSIEARKDGTMTLLDKRNNQIYSGLNQFRDGGDCGDLYNYSPPKIDLILSPRLKKVSIYRGNVQQVIDLELDLVVPKALAQDRRSRSKETVTIPIHTVITLSRQVPRVDIHTTLDNTAYDHRLRVHFPAPFSAVKGQYDGHFAVVERPIGIPIFDETWIEQPRPEVPQGAFTSISAGNARLTIANRGLPEVEVLKNARENAEIVLTLLRCVGWLSRDDLSTRKGHAGPPFLETPGAQMLGRWEYDYSIIPGMDHPSAYQEASSFETPMQVVNTGLHDGKLPVHDSFVEVEPAEFHITAIKQAEDGRGWLVRGYNLTGKEIRVMLTPWKIFKKCEQINLAEIKVASLNVEKNGKVSLPVRGCEIITVRFLE